MPNAIVHVPAAGPILKCDEGLSFWGGVDPKTGVIIDAHHPQANKSVSGRILMMPTSRGSCTGSGVLLGLAFAGHAPKALVFRESEDILTLGAVVATRLFGHDIAVLRLSDQEYDQLSQETEATLSDTDLRAGAHCWPLIDPSRDPSTLQSHQKHGTLSLTDEHHAFLHGEHGEAAQCAMEIITTLARAQGATELIPVSRVHIDGCIYASPAFLTFARNMADKGGRVRVPTTMNAISVDHARWRSQGVAEDFGLPASQLADAYVEMGARPSFTCAPYLLEDTPRLGEDIAWAESNAVIYANSVLGARTVKHADFMDLCAALTGFAPRAGVYLVENRAPRRIVNVTLPETIDDSFWPMLGWLVGQAAPDRIPLIRGLETSTPSEDDLKALCAAYGTTSASPMLHIRGITPEADQAPVADADVVHIMPNDFAQVWSIFNAGPQRIDLVALGSPHFSVRECELFATMMDGATVHPDVTVIITMARHSLDKIERSGIKTQLEAAGAQIVPDLCWCSISEPVFPPSARTIMTNSGKYAHYAPGLSKRAVRFGALSQCAEAAISGLAPTQAPAWVTSYNNGEVS